MAAPLTGKTIALVVTGSIAAYKAVEVARLAIKAGAKVIPVMTKAAQKFVGAATLAGICGERVYDDLWEPSFNGEMHIAIANRADAIVIVPATADLLARMAQGRADDLVTALVLSAKGPVFVAPAMHPRMWAHAATTRNVAALRLQQRVTFVGPVEGEVASGERGVGRLADPAIIFDTLAAALAPSAVGEKGAGSALSGKHVLISAGPTLEDLDPVRFIGNRSSGKMGFALADAVLARGANVTLVAGPVALATPHGAHRIDVRSALDMRDAIRKIAGTVLKDVDAIVMCAAVSDYRAKEISQSKTKKPADGSADEIFITLVKNPDILAEIGALRGARKSPVLVGFAVETGDDASITRYAQKKLAQKSVDLIVANAAAESFGKDDNRAILVDKNSVDALPTQSKRALADAIARRLAILLGSTS